MRRSKRRGEMLGQLPVPGLLFQPAERWCIDCGSPVESRLQRWHMFCGDCLTLRRTLDGVSFLTGRG